MTTDSVAQIVSAYVNNNPVVASELPVLIMSVRWALEAPVDEGKGGHETLEPAVPLAQSFGIDSVTCLECGHAGKTLKEHLMRAHGLSPELYRLRWNLDDDHPLVAIGTTAKLRAARGVKNGAPKLRLV